MSDVAPEPEAPVEAPVEAPAEPEPVPQADPGDEQPEVAPEEPEAAPAAPAAPAVPPGQFAVFEHTAAAWFTDLESAEAHAFEQAQHRPEDVGGALPVVAQVVSSGG